MSDEITPKAEPVIYRENVYYGTVMWLLIGGLIILYLVVLVGAVARRKAGIAVGMAVVTVFLLALLANFWKLTFIVTENEVVFGFGLVKKRFRRSDIRSCEPYTLEFRNYLGYGIRLGLDRTIAYNTRNGPGVKLTIDGAKKPYVVSVNDPGAICRLLGSRGE